RAQAGLTYTTPDSTTARLPGEASTEANSTARSEDPDLSGHICEIALTVETLSARLSGRVRFMAHASNESISHKAGFGKAPNGCGNPAERPSPPKPGTWRASPSSARCPFWEV